MRRILKSERDRAELLREITTLDLSEKTYIADVKQLRHDRTPSQNDTMWMWFRCIGNELGYSADEIHDLMVSKFLEPTEKEVAGVVLYNRGKTSALDTRGMAEFLDNVNMEALRLNIHLPMPGMEGFDEFYETYRR